MKIIENIEIRHFRSFDGGTGQSRVHIQNLGDLNVFSGANDSGKSNILRALNLFFNDEISPGVAFDKERDFSKTVSMRFDQTIVEKREQERARVEKLQAKGEDVKTCDAQMKSFQSSYFLTTLRGSAVFLRSFGCRNLTLRKTVSRVNISTKPI
jgi:AAA15 family ATPase/GTPase